MILSFEPEAKVFHGLFSPIPFYCALLLHIHPQKFDYIKDRIKNMDQPYSLQVQKAVSHLHMLVAQPNDFPKKLRKRKIIPNNGERSAIERHKFAQNLIIDFWCT